MRVLFSSVPAYGHLLPVLPIADAAHAAGDEVVVATHKSLSHLVDAPYREHGPSMPEWMDENERRTGLDLTAFRTDDPGLLAAATVTLFTSTAAALALDDRIAIVEEFRPDLLVGDVSDYVTPVVASHVGLPWASVTHSPASPFDPALEAGRDTVLAHRGLELRERLTVVETWPEWLGDDLRSWTNGLPVRPQTFTSSGHDAPPIGALSGRRRLLVSFGTVADNQDLLHRAVTAALDADHDVIVTAGLTHAPTDFDFDPGRVAVVGFTPLGPLLDQADAVVAAGGAGTTLATLSRGLPVAFLPQFANQPHIAAEVEKFGAGVVLDETADLSGGIRELLASDSIRTGAAEAASRLASRPTPAEAWASLRARV
jgi:UDP:flavonoid glycosyltransferase YjiC (YdhE family)